MTLPTALAILLAFSSFATLVYMFICRDATSRYVSVKRLGLIERDMDELKRVIVVANRVEKPMNTLQEAVEDNFRERVQYLFLVSKSNSQDEKSRYYKIFEHLARIATKGYDLVISDLIQIKSLTYEWPYPPHIFYQFLSKKSDKLLTICFKGNQRGEGIATFYEIISGSEAEPLLHSLLADAPQDIEDVEVVNDITDINLKEAKTNLDTLYKRS